MAVAPDLSARPCRPARALGDRPPGGVTGNIANASTAGYTARTRAVFRHARQRRPPAPCDGRNLSRPHLGDAAIRAGGRVWEVHDTGKPVALDEELMSADETNRSFALDTSIVRAFQRMLLSSVRSDA